MQFYDIEAYRLEHLSDLSVSAFMDRYFQKGGVFVAVDTDELDSGITGDIILDPYTLLQFTDSVLSNDPIDRDLLGLFNFIFGMDQILHQFPVIA